jgi:hypothetical protein
MRKPVQGSDDFASLKPPIGFVRQRKTSLVLQLRDDGVNEWIDLRDAIEVGSHQLARGHLAIADEARLLARGQETEIAQSRYCASL